VKEIKKYHGECIFRAEIFFNLLLGGGFGGPGNGFGGPGGGFFSTGSSSGSATASSSSKTTPRTTKTITRTTKTTAEKQIKKYFGPEIFFICDIF